MSQDSIAGAALILVDVQAGFDDPRWGPRNNPSAEDRIRDLLGSWREAGYPIFHIQHASRVPGSPLHPSGEGYALKPAVRPIQGEPVIVKSVNSAFIGTDLEARLRNEGIGAVVVAGLTTNFCVSTTARMASNLGFETFVVSDATATFDRPMLDGRIQPAEEVHQAALSDLHAEFATVLDSAEARAAVLAAAAPPRAHGTAGEES